MKENLFDALIIRCGKLPLDLPSGMHKVTVEATVTSVLSFCAKQEIFSLSSFVLWSE